MTPQPAALQRDKMADQTAGAAGPTVAVGAGGEFTLALDESGRLCSWGAADRGQLGVGVTDDAVFVPTAVRRRVTDQREREREDLVG